MSDAATLRAAVRAALNAGRAAEAEAAAHALIAAEPDADAWDLLARALRAQDKLEDAIAAGDVALKLNPSSADARYNRAIAVGRSGRVADALSEFESLVSRGLIASALWAARGDALLDLGRIEEAEAALADGVRRWPTHAGLHAALARTRWLLGQGGRFADAFEASITRHPNDIALRIAGVDLLRRAEFTARAEALLREGLARQDDDPALLEVLGVLLDETDRSAEALPLLQAAVQRAPYRADARAQMIRALLRLNRGAEALRELAPLRAAAPDDQLFLCLESMALRQTNDPRYHELCDYDLMVAAYDLPAPSGYASIAAFNEALAASLARLHVTAQHPLDQSLRQGTQTTRNLAHVDDPVIRAYLAALDEPIGAYTARMINPDHPWSGRKSGAHRIAGAWSVRLKANGFHVNHIHPGGWISSAYYVSLPDVVTSGQNQEGWIKFGEPRFPTPGCTIEKVIQPQVGRLVLFPSYMWHGTIPFSAGERLTAPFDVVPA